MILEVCAETIESAKRAVEAGADRIEFNACLAEDGLTPSMDALEKLVREVDVPVIAMNRPRAGGFVYTEGEIQAMKSCMATIADTGAAGVALGAIGADGAIDSRACEIVLQGGEGLELVFHRAFDCVIEPMAALETLIALGFDRVLTSGCAASATEGATVIQSLESKAAGRIEILPGAGISSANIRQVLHATGCNQAHGSFCSDKSPGGPWECNVEEVARARTIMDSLKTSSE